MVSACGSTRDLRMRLTCCVRPVREERRSHATDKDVESHADLWEEVSGAAPLTDKEEATRRVLE